MALPGPSGKFCASAAPAAMERSEKQAASNAACVMEKPYSLRKYCGIHTDSAVKPPNTIE